MIVMNVPGYSDSHRSTLFSASCRSFQAPSPIDSSLVPVGDDDWKKEIVDENLERMSACQAWRSEAEKPLTLDERILLQIPNTLELRSDEERSDRVEELSLVIRQGPVAHSITECADEEGNERQHESGVTADPISDCMRLEWALIEQPQATQRNGLGLAACP